MVQSFRRFGDQTETQFRHESTETPTGQILRCGWSLNGASGTMATHFGLENGKLSGHMQSGEQHESEEDEKIRFQQREWGGYYAVEQSLRKRPMSPGERRVVPGLLPFYNVVSNTVLEAGKPEVTSLLSDSVELLPVTCQLEIGDTRETHRLWVNAAGEILKSELDGVDQVTYRTDRATALSAGNSEFDLALNTSITVEGRPDDPHLWDVARYRIAAGDGTDLTELFPDDGQRQLVSPSGDHCVLDVIVDARGHALATKLDAELQRRLLAESVWIQTTDPRVAALAATIPAGPPENVVAAAETLVREHVETRNFNHAMGTAADVARTGAGDCSEHAMLLAAICRARGIPTRIAIGLVFVPHLNSFAYHMWNEALIGGHWVTLDATMERAGAGERVGAGHIKMADATFADAASLAKLNRVLTAMGALRVELLDLQAPHR